MTHQETNLTYVDWYCRKCKNFHETDHKTHSYPGKCPACEERSVYRGQPQLPTNRVWCDSEPRQYNLCGGEKTIQVYLSAATGERVGQSMDPDRVPDCDDDPLEVARAVVDVVERYIYCSSKEKIKEVLAAMEACEDVSDANARGNRIHELRKRLVCDTAELRDLMDDAADSVEAKEAG